MKYDVPLGSTGQKSAVYLEGVELCLLCGLPFLTHREPDIGVDDICPLHGVSRVRGQGNIGRIYHAKKISRGLIVCGGADRQLETEVLCGPAPRTGHITVTVTDERESPVLPASQFFPYGEQVSEDLTWVFFVCECINCWNACVGGEFLNVALGVGANNRAMHHPSENTSGVLDGFSAAELNVV